MPDLNASQLLVPGATGYDLLTTVIKVNGRPVPDTVMLQALKISRCANRIPFAVLTILDGDVATRTFDVSDIDLFSPGNTIELLAGYHGQNDSIFKGIIIRHRLQIMQQGDSYIEIECKDETSRLTIGRKNKYYLNQSDTEIIEDVLQRRNLPKTVADTGTKHEGMLQFNATDWDFMLTRAEANGMLVYVKDGEVVVKQPDFAQDPKFTLSYGVNIFEFEAEMDARDQYPSAKASVWDPDNQEIQESEPSGSAGGGGALGGLASSVGSALSSASNALGLSLPGNPPNTDYKEVMGLDFFPLRHTGALQQEEAQQWASAQMTKSKLASSRGRVKFQGAADVYPGDVIRLNGVGLRHSGAVFLTAITHEMSAGMWYTHAQFGLSQQWFAQEFDDVTEVQAAALLPAIHGLQIGVVTALGGDPENAHRIQVRLPLADNVGEGMWMRIACQDAGNNRGAFWRPEVNDEVVVGFLNDDPREGIILGMFNSSAKPTPLQDQDTNHIKGWITRSDMRMLFDDDKKSLNISTPNGKKVTIDEQADTITIEDEHRNKIVMDQSGIVIESASDLTLKAANNLNIEAVTIANKAQSAFTAEAQGKAELKASGQTVVKGGVVQIN